MPDHDSQAIYRHMKRFLWYNVIHLNWSINFSKHYDLWRTFQSKQIPHKTRQVLYISFNWSKYVLYFASCSELENTKKKHTIFFCVTVEVQLMKLMKYPFVWKYRFRLPNGYCQQCVGKGHEVPVYQHVLWKTHNHLLS